MVNFKTIFLKVKVFMGLNFPAFYREFVLRGDVRSEKGRATSESRNGSKLRPNQSNS